MANQKISDLERLVKPDDLSEADLFVVVDTDSKETPSGATKQMTAATLAQALTQLSAGLIGADFTNLRDTPNEYTRDNHGNFIKVKVETIDDQLVGGLEFVESPGASEQTFSYLGNFEEDETLFVGGLVRRTTTGKFALASSDDEQKAECVGIIKKIKEDLHGVPARVTLVFGGYVEFTPETEVGINILTSLSLEDITSTTNLDNGLVYFLGKSGRLVTFDPSEKDKDGETHVSKPVLIGTGGLTGIFVNYRGLYHPEDEEANKFIIERDESCSTLKRGDLVRAKSPKELDVSKTEFVLSSAEDFDTSDVIGIVTFANADHIEIQTNGMITFETPEWHTEDAEGIHFVSGTQYYLEDMDEDQHPDEIPPINRYTMYDKSLLNLSVAEREKLVGKPFRNSRPTDPATPLQVKDKMSGVYETFSRPVFYAITKNRILLTNHRTLPNPYLECFDCLKNSETEKSIFWPSMPTEASEVGQLQPEQESQANEFLKQVWPNAGIGHRATLYRDTNSGTITLRLRKHLNRWEELE